MSRRAARAVLVLLPTLDERKQEKLLLRWAAEHGYVVTSLTAVPAAAAALAEDGLVDVVVHVRHTAETLRMAVRVKRAGVAVDEIRPREQTDRQDLTRVQILDAARRGVPTAAIAAVLDVPVATVAEVLGSTPSSTAPAPQRQQRPRAVTGPPGRP